MKWLLRLFLATHIRLYRLTGGRVGGKLGNNAILLLYTVGRKSGRQQITPLVYFSRWQHLRHHRLQWRCGTPSGLVLQSETESPDPNPSDGQATEVTVEEAAAPLRERLWQQMIADHPQFATYQAKTARVIPRLVLHS